jgi:predicted acylesterase/phospholipase RssA
MRRQDLDKATFGIVLAGGGGRGAYQIGCWKKLKEFGLDRFSVISGTSVGALNAALIAAGDVPQAMRLWEDLEESKVVKTSAIRKWTVAFLCFVLAAVFTAALHLIFLALVLGLPLIMWMIWYTKIRELDASVSPFDLLFSLTHLAQVLPWAWAIVITSSAAMWWLLRKVEADELLVGRAVWDASVEISARIIGRFVSIGSSVPLGQLLSLNITRDQLRRTNAKVYVTLSVQDSFFDPYEPNYQERPSSFDKPDPRPRLLSEPQRIDNFWSPELVELTSLPDDSSVREALLQSANLPLVFPAGRWKEFKSVDGAIAMYKGTTQNVPILPAAENRCDYIFVLYLDASVDASLKAIRETVEAAFDLRVLRGLSAEDARRIYRTGQASGFRPPPAPPFTVEEQQLICVVPSRSLGSIVDFSGGSRAQALMRLGEEDMEKALRASPLFASYIAGRNAGSSASKH